MEFGREAGANLNVRLTKHSRNRNRPIGTACRIAPWWP